MRTLREILEKNGPIWTYKAKPFPGRYPTRWRIQFTKGREYWGKPSREVLGSALRGLLKKAEGDITLTEFDRLGMVHKTVWIKLRGNKELIPSSDNYPRIRYYTFFQERDILDIYLNARPLYPKKIKFGGKIYTLFSTSEVLKSGNVFEFKRWVSDNGVLG